MAMGNRSLTPLQRALQRNSTSFTTTQQAQSVTPLGGLEYYRSGMENNLQNGMENLATGNLNIPNHASLGNQFGTGSSNPWEALLSHKDTTEDAMGNGRGQYMSQMPNNNRVMNVRGFTF